MKRITEEVKKGKTLISDGAWGTFLQSKGLQPGECPEEWNLTHREEVLAIARSYIEAGADMVLTNSFGASPYSLNRFELSDKAFEINKVAAEISREAAGKGKIVAGSIGPSGALLMMRDVTEDELYDGFVIQAKALEAGGANAVCIETMSDIQEARIAVKAVKENTSLEIISTFTFEPIVGGGYKTMMGVTPTEVMIAMKEAGADIIGTNCGNGFEQMADVVREMRQCDPEIPILVHANAGRPIVENNVTVYPETPAHMAERYAALVASGANIIGGCCGTTPAHIHALANAAKK